MLREGAVTCSNEGPDITHSHSTILSQILHPMKYMAQCAENGQVSEHGQRISKQNKIVYCGVNTRGYSGSMLSLSLSLYRWESIMYAFVTLCSPR
jgi:hypothetical protein